MRITLKAQSGYVTAERDTPNIPLTANRVEAHEWETFDEEAIPNGVALKTSAGLYVAAEPDGSVHGNRAEAGLWETYSKEALSDGTVAYRTWRKTYLTAEVDSGPICPVTHRSTTPDAWQRFVRVALDAPPPERPEVRPPTTDLLRSDFLTAQNPAGQYVNSGEYPALSAAKQDEIRAVWIANGYNVLLMETDWPGDSHVPPFSWTQHPGPFFECLPELVAAGIQPVPLIGLEGMGQSCDAGYIQRARDFAKQAKAHGITLAVVGLECEEWSDYANYQRLVQAIGTSLDPLLTHFHGGVLAHPGGPAGIAAFYAANPALNGLLLQFDKRAVHGSFLVPDADLLAQLTRARQRLPAHIALHAGEYANGVSQAKAQQAGDICAGVGRDCWNGVGHGPARGVEPFVPVADAVPINQIRFQNLHGDITAEIRSWPVDGRLTAAKVKGNEIELPNSASGRWTLANNGILGNCWEIACVHGQWTGKTFDYIKSFSFTKDWTGGSSMKPDSGTRLAAMISGPARDKFDGERLRTNIVFVT